MLFRQYLKSLKTLAINSNKPKFVLGNSSADYDSFFGSIIYSYYLHNTNDLKQTYLPLIDCPQQDIKLRFQIYKILKDINAQPSDLLYYKQMFKNQQDLKSSKFILYDHNIRPEIPQQNIHHIVDHHFYKKLPTQKYIIYKVGSLLTILYYIYNPHKTLQIQKNLQTLNQCKLKQEKLLSEQMKKFLQCQNLQPKWKNYDKKVDQLIRYGVLIDTYGFDKNQRDRWTLYDKYAADQIQIQGNYKIGYQELAFYKFDQSLALQLTLNEHFRKDYKEFLYESKQLQKGKYLAQYSIISIHPDKFLQHYQKFLDQQSEKYHQKCLQTFGKDQQIVGWVYFLMFVYEKDNKLQKQMIFKTDNQKLTQRIQKILSNENMKKIEIQKQGWKKWNDPSCQISRKKFDALINKHL